jgi:hypothetical protein
MYSARKYIYNNLLYKIFIPQTTKILTTKLDDNFYINFNNIKSNITKLILIKTHFKKNFINPSIKFNMKINTLTNIPPNLKWLVIIIGDLINIDFESLPESLETFEIDEKYEITLKEKNQYLI